MSGETIKLVKVEEVVLRQLRQHKSRVRSKPDLSEQVNAAKKQVRQELQQHLTSLEQRNQRLEQQTPQLKTSLASSEKNTSKRLRQQQQELQTALWEAESRQQQVSRPPANQPSEFERQRSENLKAKAAAQQEYSRLMQEQAQKFEQIVAQERSSRQQEQQLQQQIGQAVSNIEQEKQRKQKLAQDLVADVQLIWQQIDRNYQHGRFARGRLTDLNRLLQVAQDNVGAGLYEAAIANAQQTYLALADLRLELEQKEQEWLLLYNAALGDVRSLIAEVRASRQCEVEVGEGNEAEKFNLDVDYWTNGRLSQYEQQLNQIVETLHVETLHATSLSGQSTLTSEQLKALTQRVAAMQPTLGEIVEQARAAVLGSQLRAEIADTVVEALSSLGYSLVDPEKDAAYEGDDQRHAYLVKVKNLAGDEVVTVINPEKEFGANSVSINAFSQSIVDEKAAQQNAQAIFDYLESAGVKGIGPTKCNHQARAEYQNVEAVKQRRTAPASQPS